MAYERLNLANGVTVDESHFKHLEDGIEGAYKAADPAGTAAAVVSAHNVDPESHQDIRLVLQQLADRINAVLDSDDATLDELSEIVDYIKGNKTLIDAITTSKVSVSDIVNNLSTNVANKPLSAAQGVVLKALIDAITVPTKVSAFENDAGYLTEHQDISGKLDADKLPEAVNDALAQAKASGEFDGKDGEDGYTPQKGVDYFDGKDGSPGKDGMSATHSWNGTTLTVTSASGTSSADLKGETGPQGPQGETGPAGPQGETGPAGRDANVTAENIASALGYVPADEETVNHLSDKKVNKSGWSAGKNLGTDENGNVVEKDDIFSKDVSAWTPVEYMNGVPWTEKGYYWTANGTHTNTQYTQNFCSTQSLIRIEPNCSYTLSNFAGVYFLYDSAGINGVASTSHNDPNTAVSFETNANQYYIGISHKPSGSFTVDKVSLIRNTISQAEYDALPTRADSLKTLYGKKVVCFGDSLFGMYRGADSAPAFVAVETGATVYNVGFGGCRMATHYLDGYAAFSMWALAKAISENDWTTQDAQAPSGSAYFPDQLALLKSIDFREVDIAVIHYGTNDFAAASSSFKMDNASDPDDYSTLCGALRYSLDKLLGKYPKMRIYISLPVYRFWTEDGITTYAENYTNSIGKTLPDFVEALRGVAAEYNLPVIDGYYGLGINKANAATFLSDGTHHNATGRERFGRYIGANLTAQQGGKDGKDGSDATVTSDNIQSALGYTPASEEAVSQLSEKITTDEYKKDVAALVPIVKVADDPTFVDSVDEMTDASKPYVLTTDGMIYAYGEKTQTVVTEAQNRFDPAAATLSARMSGSSGSVSGTAGLGSFVTDFIPVTGYTDNNPFNVVLNFEAQLHGDDKFCLFDSSKAFVKGATFSSGSVWHSNVVVGDGKTIINIRKDNSGNAINDTNVAYIRLQVYMRTNGNGGTASTALSADEIKDVTIRYQHESSTTTETVAGFVSTGIAYNQPADYEDRVISLETDVANNTGNIALLQKRVGNLESGEVETVIPTFWQTAVDECIAKIKALQVGRNCVTFPFFSDNHQRNGYAGALIAKIMKECHIPYCFYGGDSISSGTIANEAAMIAEDKAFDAMMSYVPNGRFCRAVGNHDGYWYDGTNKHTYTRTQVYELFLREEAVAQNKHFGDDGTYYYVDDIASKVRFAVLNTNGGNVDSAQLEWMQNTALSFNENGWAVVFISHQPISNHYHANIGNAAEVRVAVQAYINGSASNKAAVVGWFSGHIHRDRIYTGAATNTTDDTQGAAMGFTQVTITSDHTGIAYDDATKHTVANDDQSHAIDFVTINKDTRTVNLTRLGIGADRSYMY